MTALLWGDSVNDWGRLAARVLVVAFEWPTEGEGNCSGQISSLLSQPSCLQLLNVARSESGRLVPKSVLSRELGKCPYPF